MHEIVRRLGIVAALALALFECLYVAVLVGGFVSLESPGDPISDPFFTMMELLILLIVPAMVIMMIAVHAWAPASRKPYSLAAIVFAAILACLTSAVHFSILVLGREPDLDVWARHLTFEWPSIVYALDILAWDWFFALSVLFAAPVFRGSRLASWVRYLLSQAEHWHLRVWWVLWWETCKSAILELSAMQAYSHSRRCSLRCYFGAHRNAVKLSRRISRTDQFCLATPSLDGSLRQVLARKVISATRSHLQS